MDEIEWRVSPQRVEYPEALATMEARAAAVAAGEARELVWLLEHPPLYTAGTSADPAELIDPRFPVFPAGRGGRYTYHGPGQRVVYLMLDLDKRGRDVRCFVHSLEGWVIAALGSIGVEALARGGAGRHLDARTRRPGSQDRRDRRSRPPLGDAARHVRSTSIRTCRTSPESCPAASQSIPSPA